MQPPPRDPSEDRTKTSIERDETQPRQGRVLVFWDGGFTSGALPAEGQVTFGRSKECEICIDHSSVSRKHAVLHLNEPLRIEDLGSSNGTRVAGQRIPPNHPYPIGPGDVLEIGGARVLLDRATLGASNEPSRAVAEAAAPPMGSAIIRDEAMAQVFRLIELVAPSHLSVIVCGETGVGKELAAVTVHRLSRRAQGPFLRLNCAALPEALLESELFGHERGAFTGALQAKTGLLEAAHGGTAFLDEVGEIPLAAQAKLLRVLESREVTRVGGLVPRAIDVRFVAATHRDLPARVAAGAFRQDLYFRLNGVSIFVPPLRQRQGEIGPFAASFAAAAARSMGRPPPAISRQAMVALEEHSWPGNVRELRNAIERAVVVCQSDTIGLEHLPPEIAGEGGFILGSRPPPTPPSATSSAAAPVAPPSSNELDLRGELDAVEKRRILDALERCAGNQGRAAEMLGISRRTLLSRLDAFGLPRPRKGHGPAKR